VQAITHAGYELAAKDFHDMRALREQFGVALPDEYG